MATRDAPRRPSRLSVGRVRGEWLTGYLFVLPATLVIGVFGLFPILYAIYMSLHRWRIRRSGFVGLEHYERTLGDIGAFGVALLGIALIGVAHWLWTDLASRSPWRQVMRLAAAVTLLFAGIALALGWQTMALTGDTRFLMGLVRTFYYGFISVPVQITLALVLASLLFQPIAGRQIYRMLFFLPYVTPVVAGAAVFRSIFSPREERLVNTVLSWFGIDAQRWLFETRPVGQLLFGDLFTRAGMELPAFLAGGPSLALLTIILFGIWTYTGYNAVIFLAGLGGIPKELYEAAAIDGANGPARFFHITVPLLAPITFYLTVLGFIGTFQAFTQLYVMREAAVRGAVDTAALVIFDTFYRRSDFGLAAAQSVVLFAIILALTLLQNRLFGRRALRG